MAQTTKLYRLLREDEKDPLKDGIVARRPLHDDPPMVHIRHGSKQTSQWISTSREISAIDVLIRYKRKRRRGEGDFSRCRIVEIDEELLKSHARRLKLFVRVFEKMRTHPGVTDREKSLVNKLLPKLTGQILDFTDNTVLDTHIPSSTQNERARGYATRYKEVLVERFIPAKCCITVNNR